MTNYAGLKFDTRLIRLQMFSFCLIPQWPSFTISITTTWRRHIKLRPRTPLHPVYSACQKI